MNLMSLQGSKGVNAARCACGRALWRCAATKLFYELKINGGGLHHCRFMQQIPEQIIVEEIVIKLL